MAPKTVAQKRGDDVRHIADKLKKLRLGLAKKKIPDTIHLNQLVVRTKNERGEVVLQLNQDKLKRWAGEVAQQTGKISGVGGLWLLEYLMRGLNTIVVDNAVIRNMEELSKKKATTNFGKKHSWVESYLLYFMMVGTMALSGGQLTVNALNQDKDKDNEKEKKEAVVPNKEQSVKKELKTISPQDANFVQNAVDEYWEHIAVVLTELETYRDTSMCHDGEERETNGLGCTWHYKYDKKGVLHQYPNKLGETKKWSRNYNYGQARRHLIFETMPALQRAIKNYSNITAQHQIALILAGYQRPADMKLIADKISKAKNTQEIADAFMVYNGKEKWKVGTWRRRWWCAAYATGAISTKDFLNLSRDAFSHINLNRVMQNGHFMMTEDVVEYALTVAKAGTKSTVKDFLNTFEEGQDIVKTVNAGTPKTISFNSAIKQIRKKNARGDLMLYGAERVFDNA